jgi:hypothetical protein
MPHGTRANGNEVPVLRAGNGSTQPLLEPLEHVLRAPPGIGSSLRLDARDLLARRISTSREYVFLASHAVTAPGIVEALLARLRQPAPPVVILLVSHPCAFQRAPTDVLQFSTFASLAFQTCVRVSVRDRSVALPRATKTLARVVHRTWSLRLGSGRWGRGRAVSSSLSRQWLELDRVEWRDWSLPWLGRQSARLLDILGFDGGLRMYSPVRATSPGTWAPLPIDSTLALIDDETAFTGSARLAAWNREPDGEPCTIIEDPQVVRTARERLFQHYGMGAPALWSSEAVAHLQSFQRQAALPGLRVIPLELADFDKIVPNRWESATGGPPCSSTPTQEVVRHG